MFSITYIYFVSSLSAHHHSKLLRETYFKLNFNADFIKKIEIKKKINFKIFHAKNCSEEDVKDYVMPLTSSTTLHLIG